jgi:phosphoglycerol transferase
VFKSINSFLLRDSASAKVPLLFGSIALIIYLTARTSGLYPVIFADEWIYSAYSRYILPSASPRPSYLFYALYKSTNYCGDAFLDCARQMNVVFFALSLPLIYGVCRRFAPVNLSILVSLCAVFSPVNSYSAYFMPESMNFFFFWLFTWCVVTGYDTKPALMAAAAGLVLACMSMVKPHAVFLFPAYLVALFSSWIFDRNAAAFKHAFRLATISISAFFLLRLPLGYMLVGANGINIMGSEYGGYATSMSRLDYMISLSPLARYNLWGHMLGLGLVFGVPLALMLQVPFKKSVDCSASDRKLRFLKLYAASLLMSLTLIVALFTAKAVSMSPLESISRLSLRHYDFTFPLLLIVAASTLASTSKTSPGTKRWKWSCLPIAGLIAYALATQFVGYTPYFHDAPELLVFASDTPTYLVLGAVGLLCLFLAALGKQEGITLYLLVFFPLTMVTSADAVSSALSYRMSADVYDQAGQFASRYLGKDTAKLMIVGPDLASLYRTQFYMSTPGTLFLTVPNGQPLDTKRIPEDRSWLLLIGNYQHSYDPMESIHIPVKGASGDLPGDYTLMRISHTTSLQIIPGQNAQHSIARIDPASKGMVSEAGKTHAVIFGLYKQAQPGEREVSQP